MKGYTFLLGIGLTLCIAFARDARADQGSASGQSSLTTAPPTTGVAPILWSVSKFPIVFEENHGQADLHVKYVSHLPGRVMLLTGGSLVVTLSGAPSSIASGGAASSPFKPPGSAPQSLPTSAITFSLVGAKDEAIRTEAQVPLGGTVNYFIGRNPSAWLTKVPTYGRVACRDVLPGIDAIYYGSNGRLEYDLVLAPGASPSALQIAIDGADTIQLTPSGDLDIATASGTIRHSKPIAFQMVQGQRLVVPCWYTLPSPRLALVNLSDYDHSLPLYVDPQIQFSTFLGGSGADSVNGVAVDNASNCIVTGYTSSTNLITFSAATRGPYRTSYSGAFDAFVTSLSPSGSLVYSTYLGGSSSDSAFGITIDANGNAWITGATSSHNFPLVTPFQKTFPTTFSLTGAETCFISEISPDGSRLLYSTFLGASGEDRGRAIRIDSVGNICVAGTTFGQGFPLVNPLIPYLPPQPNGFLCKLNAKGSSLVFSTLLGGALGLTKPFALALDPANDLYVGGTTFATDYPTKNAFQSHPRNIPAGFITKVTPSGGLVWSTFLSGNADTEIYGLGVDSAAQAWVTGFTSATSFPLLYPSQAALAGSGDAILTGLASSGSSLIYSTYFGQDATGWSVYVDKCDKVYLAGAVGSSNFPTVGSLQAGPGGSPGVYAFASAFDPATRSLKFSTFLGGGAGGALGIAVDPGRNIVVGGLTVTASFPTVNAFQGSFGGGSQDGWVARISSPWSDAAPTFSQFSASPLIANAGTTVSVSFSASERLYSNPHVTVAGSDASFIGLSGLTYSYSWKEPNGLPDGAATVAVQGIDACGNTGTSSAQPLTIDNTPPSIASASATPALAAIGTTVTFNVTWTEAVTGVPSLSVGGVRTQLVSTAGVRSRFSLSITKNVGSPCPTFSGTATDLAGNTGTSTAPGCPLVTDFVAPTFAIDAAPAFARLNTLETLNVTASEPLAAPPTLQVGTKLLSPVSSSGLVYTFQVVIDTRFPQGPVTVTAKGTDLAGNTGSTSATPFAVELTAPSFSTFSVSPNLATTGTVVTIAFKASETLGSNPTVAVGSQAAVFASKASLNYTYTAKIDRTAGEGHPNIVVSGYDQAGNLGTTTAAGLLTTDFTAPAFANFVAKPSRATTGTVVAISCTASEALRAPPTLSVGSEQATRVSSSGNTYGFTVTISTAAGQGSPAVVATGADVVGLTGSTLARPLATNFYPPKFSSLTAAPSPAKSGTSVTLQFASSEPLTSAPSVTVGSRGASLLSSAGLNYAFSVVASSPGVPEGTPQVSILATDPFGLNGTTVGYPLVTDYTPPSFSSIRFNPRIYGLGQSMIVTFSASETLLATPQVSVASLPLSLQAKVAPLTYTFARTLDGTEPQGSSPIKIVGTDLAGNVGANSSTIARIDTILPTALSPTRSPAIATIGTKVKVAFSTSESLVTTPSVRVAGQPASLVSSSGLTYLFQRTFKGNETKGTSLIVISMFDLAFNQGTDSSLSIQFTTTPPAAVMSAFPTTPREGENIQFSGLASSSPFGITSYAWSFGDGATSTAVQPVHSYGVGPLSPSVTLTVTDGNGTQASTSLALQVSNVSPTVTLDPIPSSVRGITTLSWNTSDPGYSDSFKYDLLANDLVTGTTTQLAKGQPNKGRFLWDTGTASESIFQLVLTVSDKGSGQGTTSSQPILVDNLPLTVTLGTPDPQVFNPALGESTFLPYFLSEHATATLTVVSAKSQPNTTLVTQVFQLAGPHGAFWNGLEPATGKPLAGGVYGYTVTAVDLSNKQVVASSLNAGVQITLLTTAPPPPTVDPVLTPTRIASIVTTGRKTPNTAVVVSRAGTILTSTAPDVQFTWSLPITLVQGVNRLQFAALDLGGNQSSPVTTDIVLNTIAPSAPVVGPVLTPTTQPSQVITGTKDANTSILVNGSASVPLSPATTWTFASTYRVGTTTFTFVSEDAEGNLSTPTTISITLLPNAINAPTLNPVVSPTQISLQQISGTKDPGTLVIVTRANPFASPQSATSQTAIDNTTSWSLSIALPDGPNVLSLQGFDSIGSPSSATTASIVVDTRPPLLAITGIADGAITTDPNITLGLSYSDPNPGTGVSLLSLRVSVDGSDITSEASIGSAAASLPSLALTTGLHIIAVGCSDAVGNATAAVASFSEVPATLIGEPIITVVKLDKAVFNPAYNPYTRIHSDQVTVTYAASQEVTPVLHVFTSAGATVLSSTLPVALPGNTYSAAWNGTTSDGVLVDAGYYTIGLSASNPSNKTTTTPSVTIRVTY